MEKTEVPGPEMGEKSRKERPCPEKCLTHPGLHAWSIELTGLRGPWKTLRSIALYVHRNR